MEIASSLRWRLQLVCRWRMMYLDLRSMGNHFRALDRATFACDYSSYVDEMSKSGTYGDDITLMAAAALFLRPVRVVGPDAEAHEGIRKFNPPSNVSVEAWGHPIVLGFVDWCHYEATCPLESRPPLKAEPRWAKTQKRCNSNFTPSQSMVQFHWGNWQI